MATTPWTSGPLLAASGALMALLLADAPLARADLESPLLGQRCSETGSCGNGNVRFRGVLTRGANAWNSISIQVLRSANLNPFDAASWKEVAFTQIYGPTTKRFDITAPINREANGEDSWATNGMARVRIVVTSSETGETYELPVRFKDQDTGAVRALSTTNWFFPDSFTTPNVGHATQDQVILLDDRSGPWGTGRKNGYLTRRFPSFSSCFPTNANATGPCSEARTDTKAYYNTVRVGADGVSGGTITTDLPNLDAFKRRYFATSTGTVLDGVVTRYFNKGDLGIGREMHCLRKSSEIACYVKNYSSSLGAAPFFGGPASNAFTNMANNRHFATVAMVARLSMAANAANRVFFAVYNEADQLADAAALDANGVKGVPGFTDTRYVEGRHYSNHIPTNCLSCHGAKATYNKTTHAVTGAVFLPFDLDQFEFNATHTRSGQEANFKAQNVSLVKLIADDYVAKGNSVGKSISDQIALWYANSPTFLSNALPSGWSSAPDTYRQVVRPYCRGCHISMPTGPLTFSTSANFDSLAGVIGPDVCDGDSDPMNRVAMSMPHAWQTAKLFWTSDARAKLFGALKGNLGQTSSGATLIDCVPAPATF